MMSDEVVTGSTSGVMEWIPNYVSRSAFKIVPEAHVLVPH